MKSRDFRRHTRHTSHENTRTSPERRHQRRGWPAAGAAASSVTHARRPGASPPPPWPFCPAAAPAGAAPSGGSRRQRARGSRRPLALRPTTAADACPADLHEAADDVRRAPAARLRGAGAVLGEVGGWAASAVGACGRSGREGRSGRALMSAVLRTLVKVEQQRPQPAHRCVDAFPARFDGRSCASPEKRSMLSVLSNGAADWHRSFSAACTRWLAVPPSFEPARWQPGGRAYSASSVNRVDTGNLALAPSTHGPQA